MQLPTPSDVKQILPLAKTLEEKIENHRKEIGEIIQGTSPLWAIVLGPCSLHDVNSAKKYANSIRNLQKYVAKTCKLVMRAHIEKPRSCMGWKGLLYDPFLDGSYDIAEGIFLSRSLLLELISSDVALASEFLEPLASLYFSDLISWGFIGARTSASQIHRQLASSLTMPIGFKNATNGDLESAIQGALTAKSPHQFLHIDETGRIVQARSKGNTLSHIVLRGSYEAPNYHPSSIENALSLSFSEHLFHRLMVDCAHSNSLKKPYDQKDVALSVLDQYLCGNKKIMGIMLESHLKAGNQPIGTKDLDPSISITDPCLDWESTEDLVISIHEYLLKHDLQVSLL